VFALFDYLMSYVIRPCTADDGAVNIFILIEIPVAIKICQSEIEKLNVMVKVRAVVLVTVSSITLCRSICLLWHKVFDIAIFIQQSQVQKRVHVQDFLIC